MEILRHPPRARAEGLTTYQGAAALLVLVGSTAAAAFWERAALLQPAAPLQSAVPRLEGQEWVVCRG